MCRDTLYIYTYIYTYYICMYIYIYCLFVYLEPPARPEYVLGEMFPQTTSRIRQHFPPSFSPVMSAFHFRNAGGANVNHGPRMVSETKRNGWGWVKCHGM